jgi:hypothetical protein
MSGSKLFVSGPSSLYKVPPRAATAHIPYIATGQLATMARHLYRSLPQPQQQGVDNAQAQGQVNYKQDDQVAAVEQIFGLLGKAPPMSLVSRLIRTLNDVIECKRGTTERLSTFVSRFWGLASTHLMHTQASQDFQMGEMLAIVLTLSTTARLPTTY